MTLHAWVQPYVVLALLSVSLDVAPFLPNVFLPSLPISWIAHEEGVQGFFGYTSYRSDGLADVAPFSLIPPHLTH